MRPIRILGLGLPALALLGCSGTMADVRAPTVYDSDMLAFIASTEAEPMSPEQFEGSRAGALESARQTLEAYKVSSPDSDLAAAAVAAAQLSQLDLAEELGQMAVELIPTLPREWYYGNVVHYAHITLGLVAIRRGDVPQAVRELELAGNTPGSPQLNSFGPTMQLATELLERDERQAVLRYLRQCRSFWEMGEPWLDMWEGKIRGGEIPNFFTSRFAT